MEQHRLTQEAVFGAVARLAEISAALLGLGPVTTAEVHAELAKQYPGASFRTPTREAVYLQLHRLKKKRLLLSKRQGKEVSWELAARGRKLLVKKAQREKEAEMRDDVEILAEEERLKGIFGGGTQGEAADQKWARAMSEVSPEPNNDEGDDGA